METKQIENMIYVNVNQTTEEKILTIKNNIFSTITNSSFLNTYDKKSYEELIEMIKNNNNILIPSLPIFRFSEDGKKDDTVKAFSFSLGVVHNDYEHGKYELLTVDELKKYLSKNVWIFIYSISDEPYENKPFRWRTIILNKCCSNAEGNATEEEINRNIIKHSSIFNDDSKNEIISKWENAGLIDSSKSYEEKLQAARYLNIAEGILSKDGDDNKEYQVVVYPIIVRLIGKVFLKIQSISQIIKDIKKEYELVDKNEHTDFELKFVETYVDKFQKKYAKHKHLMAILNALDSGENNDVTKLIVGLSKLEKYGSKTYEGIDYDWLFSDYYEKCDKDLTKEEIEKKNEEAYQYFIQENNKFADFNNKIDKLLNYLSEFYDNKNPYPLMLFSETFNIDEISENDVDLIEKYSIAINHPVMLELRKIYEKYKIYTQSSNFNKYFIAKQHQLIDYLINYYELNDFIKIDSQKCHQIANRILNKIDNKFDAKLFMEKYIKARTYEMMEEFEAQFVQQYLRFIGLLPEIKLF